MGSAGLMRAELVMVVTADLAGLCRGRAFPEDDLDERAKVGVGWVPANQALTPFGTIANDQPFGAVGDLRLVPDLSAELRLPGTADGGRPPLRLLLADVTHTDGQAWSCCPRAFLRQALADLRQEAGLGIVAAFEHEFTVRGMAAEPAFSVRALRAVEPLGTRLVAILAASGFEPETWLPEYGPAQYELNLRPADALTAADRAVLLREAVREVARDLNLRASFSPMLDPGGIGNGVHLHLSLVDLDGTPVGYDPARPGGLSEVAGSFAAGVLRYSRALVALTAPSVVSYLRLAPHRWSAAAAFLGERHREALLRICPLVELAAGRQAAQYNLEYRAADAAANPHLALAAVVRAGLEGIRAGLPAPPVVTRDLDGLTEAEQAALGVTPLPRSLAEALTALTSDPTVRSWFPSELWRCYLGIKQAEIELAGALDPAEACARYADVY